MQSSILILAVLAAAPAPATTAAAVSAHGIQIVAPDGWVQSKDGTSFVFSSPTKDAQISVDLFEKDKAGDSQDCVDQLVTKMAGADKQSKDSYVATAIDGQPAATQVTFTDDRKHRQKRIVGCNGKAYFLIDWVELTHAGPKYEKVFTKLLSGIKYAQAQ